MSNERAFPWCGDLNETPTINLGMTLRDYFAAKAMQGMMANGFIPHMVKPDGSVLQKYNYAEVAYKLADAMLEARE